MSEPTSRADRLTIIGEVRAAWEQWLADRGVTYTEEDEVNPDDQLAFNAMLAARGVTPQGGSY